MNQIERFLRDKEMTQGKLADVLGYDVSYVNQIINGKRKVTDAFRWRWMEAFGAAALRVLENNNGDGGADDTAN